MDRLRPGRSLTGEHLGVGGAGRDHRVNLLPDRVVRLKRQLREVADRRLAAGDPDGDARVAAAQLVLLRSPTTAENQFLCSVCYTALRNALRPGLDRAAPAR